MKIIFTLTLFTFTCIHFYGQVNVETKQNTQAVANDTSVIKAAGLNMLHQAGKILVG
jgi:hypothetical protein